VKKLPHADTLKRVSIIYKTMFCLKSDWRAIAYKETSNDEVRYFCMYCKKWVTEDEHHKMRRLVFPSYIMGPK